LSENNLNNIGNLKIYHYIRGHLIRFTFAILQEQGVFSDTVYNAAHRGAAQVDF